jgi:hypothetical protein
LFEEGRGEGRRENDRRSKSKIYYKHIHKYHNVSPVRSLYANKILKNKLQQ